MAINLYTEGIRFPFHGITKKKIMLLADRACRALDLAGVSISLILTDNEYIRQINKKYRKKNRPTDVISFAYRENPFPEVDAGLEELGDIYLSMERALGQAEEYNVSLENELKRLLVHGFLHLVGYDHERSKKDEKVMRQMEEEILNKIS
jgi:probable rRNA maturation factor